MVSGEQQEYSFEITHEEVVKKRYLTLYNRRIRFPAHADKPVHAPSPTRALSLYALSPNALSKATFRNLADVLGHT